VLVLEIAPLLERGHAGCLCHKNGLRMAFGEWGKLRFGEDQWFGSSLAIQFWNLYSMVNERGKTLKDAWDCESLKFTFRRTVDRRTIEQWHELAQIASGIQFSDDKDAII
jgi:hypothetical protein